MATNDDAAMSAAVKAASDEVLQAAAAVTKAMWPSRGGRRISSSTAAYPRRPSSLVTYSSNAYRLPAGSAPAGSTRLGRLSDAAAGNASVTFSLGKCKRSRQSKTLTLKRDKF